MTSFKQFKDEFEKFVNHEDTMVYEVEKIRSVRKGRLLNLELDEYPTVKKLLETLLESAEGKDEKLAKEKVASFLADHSYAFDLLSQFAINLIRQPWKYMYMPIKTYTATYAQYLKRFGDTLNKIFKRLGYEENEDHWKFIESQYEKNELIQWAFYLHVAALECELILELFNKCNGKEPLSDLFRFRLNCKGDKASYEQWKLLGRANPFNSKSAKSTEKHVAVVSNNEEASINSECDKLTDPPVLKDHSLTEREGLRGKDSDEMDNSVEKQTDAQGTHHKVAYGRGHEPHSVERGTRALQESGLEPQQDRQSSRLCKCGSSVTEPCQVCKIKTTEASVGNKRKKYPATEDNTDLGRARLSESHDKDVKSEQLTKRKESETRISDAMPKDKSISGAVCRDKEVVYAKRSLASNRWYCGHCNHLNSGDNVFCEECCQEPVFYGENALGALKEASASPGISVRRDSFGKWICPKCNKLNGGVECYDCTSAPALEVTREYTGSGFRTPLGGWIADLTGMYWCCPNCKGKNHKDLEVCGTCKIAPRLIDNKHGVSGIISVQETPTVRRDSTGKWTCPKCSKWNGGMECYRCKFQVSGENLPGGVLRPLGDWTVEFNEMFWRCPNCDVENSGSLTVCNTCKIAPRSITETKYGTTGSTPVREKLPVRRNSTGQWQCPKCFEWKSDRECYKCKVVPSLASTPECAVAGDEKRREGWVVQRDTFGGWNCPKCHGKHFKEDDKCYNCNIKPSFFEKKPKVCQECNMTNPNSTYCKSCYTVLK